MSAKSLRVGLEVVDGIRKGQIACGFEPDQFGPVMQTLAVHVLDIAEKRHQEAIAAAIANERERCAAVCESNKMVAEYSGEGLRRLGAIAMAESCARLIRKP